MATDAITIVDASEAHFDAILRIDRADRDSGGGSIMGLLGEDGLRAALARGHWIAMATLGDDVEGWIWFGIELKNGETVCEVFHVSVRHDARGAGVGRALLDHARSVAVPRGCSIMTLNVDAAADGARAFFRGAGFSESAVSMEQRL
jgi:GNAT superfamily N-acetyltransferase